MVSRGDTPSRTGARGGQTGGGVRMERHTYVRRYCSFSSFVRFFFRVSSAIAIRELRGDTAGRTMEQ